jgi:Mg2+ and Co2+ transporter CorA
MTTIRDFSPEVPRHSHQESGRERASTWHTRSGRSSPENVRRSSPSRRDSTAREHARRTSPPARDSMTRDRRGSVISRVDSFGSNNEGHIRHRRLERTNTIKTFHSSEPEIDVFQQPGAEPGIDVTVDDEKVPPHLINLVAPCDIQIVDFSETNISVQKADNATLSDLLEAPKPEDTKCRWINVNGLSWDVIKTIGNRFRLHRLAIEDLIHTHSRTKVDWYSDQAMIVLTLQKLVRLHQHDDDNDDCPAHQDTESVGGGAKGGWWPGPREAYKEKDVLPRYLDRDHDGKIDEFVKAHSNTSETSPIKDIRTLHRYESSQIAKHTAFMEKHSVLANEDLVVSVEQVSIFLLADNTIVSWFEHSAEDIETPILQRLMSEETVLRSSCDASLVLQAIIDAIVDLAMPVRNAYNKARKELQVDAMTSPNVVTSRALHIFGEEIDMLQNLIKPIVHLVNALRDHNTEPHMAMAPLSELNLNHNQPNMGSYPVENRQHKESFRQPLQSRPTNKHLAQAAQLRGRSQSPTPRLSRQVSETLGPLKRNPDAATVQITPLAHTYFGDVLDHCITLIQSLEQMDASASNISTLVFNTVQAKTNNFMAVLAIVTVFYAPLTVVSGYFGMNFASGAGLKHKFSYYFAVAIPITAASMLLVVLFVKFGEISEWLEKKWKRRRRRERKRRVKR